VSKVVGRLGRCLVRAAPPPPPSPVLCLVVCRYLNSREEPRQDPWPVPVRTALLRMTRHLMHASLSVEVSVAGMYDACKKAVEAELAPGGAFVEAAGRMATPRLVSRGGQSRLSTSRAHVHALAVAQAESVAGTPRGGGAATPNPSAAPASDAAVDELVVEGLLGLRDVILASDQFKLERLRQCLGNTACVVDPMPLVGTVPGAVLMQQLWKESLATLYPHPLRRAGICPKATRRRWTGCSLAMAVAHYKVLV
jgi:hypothetical protein